MENDSMIGQKDTILHRERIWAVRFLATALFFMFALFFVGITSVWGYASTEENVAQWAFDNDGSLQYEDNTDSWYGDMEMIHSVAGIDIHLQPVRQAGDIDQRECIIALIDTGVDILHPALKGQLWKNEDEIAGDGIDNDGNGYVDDTAGWNFYKNSNMVYNSRSSTEDAHGTHLAGTMIGNDPEAGFEGVAGNVSSIRLMPVKVVGGPDQTGSIEDLIKGIKYAEENGASICNISLAFEKWNEEVYQTIKDSNMLFVTVAGNGEADTHGKGFDLGTSLRYPACYGLDNVIVTANLKCDGTLHYSSNYSENYVDLAAPGTKIYSTSTHKSGYEVMTGTSMAAPMVSAAAALVYASHEDWDILQVKQAVLGSARKLDGLSGLVKTGGMLDVAGAVFFTGTSFECPSTPCVNIEETPSETEKVSVTIPPETEEEQVTIAPEAEKGSVTATPEVEKELVTAIPEVEKELVTTTPEVGKEPMEIQPPTGGGFEEVRIPETTERSLQKGNTNPPGKIRKITTTFQGKKLKIMTGTVKGADGYEIVLSTDRRRKEIVGKKKSVRGSAVFTKRKRKETYYVTVRAYKKTKDGGFLYGIGKMKRVKTR